MALFWKTLCKRPFRTLAGLFLEYTGFVAAILFVVLLVITRVPLRVLDRLLGLRLRERAIELIARVSPG